MKKILLTAILGLGLLTFAGCYADKSSCNSAKSIKAAKCGEGKATATGKCGASGKCGQGKCGSEK